MRLAFCIDSRHSLTWLLAFSRLAALCARFWFSSSRPAGNKSTTKASGTRCLALTAMCTSTRSPLARSLRSSSRPFMPRYSRRIIRFSPPGTGACCG
ncbi:hypothetical protein D3C75_1227210 [compost metagenome]